jgi:hypothetical protein
MKRLTVLVLILLIAGCSGVDTLRITSTPTQAKIYLNGEYHAKTPCSVPADWYNILGIYTGDRVNLIVEKEGYKTIEKSIPASERKVRTKKGDVVKGSEFGTGSTFVYTFILEPLQNK